MTFVGVAAVVGGFVAAAVSGYAAIAILLKLITTRGFLPFAAYCFVIGTTAVIVL